MENSRRSAKNADPVGTALHVFAQRLSGTPAPARPILVAYSGGLDSTVLLRAAVHALGADRLIAVHVHHGLQVHADAWALQCADQAAGLGVDFVCMRVGSSRGRTASSPGVEAPVVEAPVVEAEGSRVAAGACHEAATAPPVTSDGLEAWARSRRYAALESVARERGADVVLTAHHADDQVETVLMRIARGTGADGLTAMRSERPLSRGLPGVRLVRPLLALPRAALVAYAREHALHWVEDPSNCDPRMLRNALRAQVLPVLDAIAPAFRANLLRTVAHVAVAADALRARARVDLLRAALDASDTVRRVDRRGLAGLDRERQAAALRAWCAMLGLRPPTQGRLDEMLRQLLDGRGAYGRVRHEGHVWTRYRDTIEARLVFDQIDERRPEDERGARTASGSCVLRWNGEPVLPVPHTGGALHVQPAAAIDGHAPGLPHAWLRSCTLEIGPGRGAERLRLHPAGSSRSLRHRYQERGIPASLRPHLPVVRVEGRLLYAAGVGADHSPDWPYVPGGLILSWQPDEPADPRSACCAQEGR